MLHQSFLSLTHEINPKFSNAHQNCKSVLLVPSDCPVVVLSIHIHMKSADKYHKHSNGAKLQYAIFMTKMYRWTVIQCKFRIKT